MSGEPGPPIRKSSAGEIAGISSGGVRRKSDSLVAIMTILKLPHSHCILPGRGGFRTSRRMNRDVPMSYGI